MRMIFICILTVPKGLYYLSFFVLKVKKKKARCW